ncbi:Uncharacterised protein g2610 [Pycnogonum litorale]
MTSVKDLNIGARFNNVNVGQIQLVNAVRQAKFAHTRLLVDGGADVNCVTELGESPLILATCQVKDSGLRNKFIKLLLRHGADPNVRDDNGQTALMHAAILGHLDVCMDLTEHDETDVGLQDNEGNTALMYAAAFGQSDIVRLFVTTHKDLRSNLNLQQKNNHKLGACQLAVQNGHETCVRLLTREAQLFPEAMHQFPDPSDLERAPTPSKMKYDKKETKSEDRSNDGRLPNFTSRSDSTESVGQSGNEADTESVTVSAIPILNKMHVKKRGENERFTENKCRFQRPKLISVSPSTLVIDVRNVPKRKKCFVSLDNHQSTCNLPQINLNASISSTKSDTGAVRLLRGRNKAKSNVMIRRRTEENLDETSSSNEYEHEELQDLLSSSCRSEPWSNKSTWVPCSTKSDDVRLPPIRRPTNCKESSNDVSSNTADCEHETSASSDAENMMLFRKRTLKKKSVHKI